MPRAAYLALLAAGLVVVMLFCGCATGPRPGAQTGAIWWNPLTWMSASEVRSADKANAAAAEATRRAEAARDDILRAAQRAAHEAVLALLSAPASRATSVASESATHAAANLDQALGALPAETQAAIRRQIEALLSDNAALRAQGEQLRATQRDRDAEASRRLADAETKAAAATAKATAQAAELRAAFDRENALANELRTQRWIAGLSTAASVGLGLLALAYRANIGGMATAAAGALADLERKHGASVATLARGALDAGLNRGEQTTIARAFAKIAPDLISRS